MPTSANSNAFHPKNASPGPIPSTISVVTKCRGTLRDGDNQATKPTLRDLGAEQLMSMRRGHNVQTCSYLKYRTHTSAKRRRSSSRAAESERSSTGSPLDSVPALSLMVAGQNKYIPTHHLPKSAFTFLNYMTTSTPLRTGWVAWWPTPWHVTAAPRRLGGCGLTLIILNMLASLRSTSWKKGRRQKMVEGSAHTVGAVTPRQRLETSAKK